MKSRGARWMVVSGVCLLGFVVGMGVSCVHHLGKVHRHCIKGVGFALHGYAQDHGGAFPYHTNGFGDALLLLIKGGYDRVNIFCAPGDDGHVLSSALTNGSHVPEEACTRVYVQGLSETNAPELCILFDRHSCKGGDHRYGHGPLLREVCLLDGSMQIVTDARWPEFSRRQVELLIAAGFSRQKALEYYPEAEAKK